MTTESEEELRAWELVHAEAVRALDYQRGALDTLRARVGLLFSAGAIATSFLGGQALRGETDAWAWMAIALFVGFGIVALRILWPRAEGAEGFTAVPSVLIAEYLERQPRRSLRHMYRDLALYAEARHDLNRDRHLKPLTWYFRGAISLLIAEIAAWVIALASQ